MDTDWTVGANNGYRLDGGSNGHRLIKQFVILVVYKCIYATYPKPTPPKVGNLDLKKSHFHHCQRKRLAESRDIVDYHSTNAQYVQILSRFTAKMTRFVLPYIPPCNTFLHVDH